MGGPGCPFSNRTTNSASLANDIDHGDVRSACWDCRPSRPHLIVLRASTICRLAYSRPCACFFGSVSWSLPEPEPAYALLHSSTRELGPTRPVAGVDSPGCGCSSHCILDTPTSFSRTPSTVSVSLLSSTWYTSFERST